MSMRQKSLRFAIALSAIITISSLTFAASTWTNILTLLPFASAGTSVDDGSANAEPVVEPRRVEGRRVDMDENGAVGTLIGTYNIPGDYATLEAAITDLNLQGVGGAVTLNVLGGNPQTSPAGGYVVGGAGSLVLTTTSMTNTVTIQGNGNTVTAPTTHTIGALNDGIFKLIGADWITISGFVMNENAANTVTAAATNTMTEWGVALLYVTATDNANNCTITGNTIDLNRTYQNTFGIYANATHTATAVSVSATATGAAGGNSGLAITANNITDVNNGIVVVGPTAATDMNDGLTIGGTAPNANTITNYGTTGTFSTYANVSGTVNGILVRNSKNANVSFNSISSSVGGVTLGTLNGIQFPAFSAAPTGTFTQNVNNNTISLQSGLIAGAMTGISCPSGSASATSVFNANNNNFVTWGHTVAGTGAITFITNTSTHFTQSISNNTFTNISVNTTGNVLFISNSNTLPAGGTKNVNNNSIVTGFSKTGAGGTVTFFTDNGSDPGTATNNTNGNNFSNVSLTGGTTLAGISNTNGGSPIKNVSNNTITNITGGTASVTAMTLNFDAGTTTSTGNVINNVSGGAAVTGISLGTSSGSPGVTNLAQNTINTLSGTSTSLISGIVIAGSTGTRNVFRNKIYDLSNSSAGTGFAVQGIQVSSGTIANVFNNLIGDLRMPNGVGSDLIRGINITSTTTTSNVNVSFNTVYLNASTVSATSGTSALFHTISTTATTGTLNLRSNILVNTSTPAGAGATVAYRRSAGAASNLANYGSVSNNNLFYAGTPGPSNLIYSDGTSTAQTITAYKNGVFTAGTISPRDSNSISENPPFLSTTGSSGDFLHVSTVTPTQVEGGGTPVTGITDDYDGDTRNVGTPDIGADEFTGIPIDMVGPNITYTPLLNTGLTTNRVLSATITDASGVAGGGFAPRIYFRKNAGSYVSTQCGAPTGNVYPCTIDNSLVGGVVATDVIDYFVVAQDTLGNVSANPGGGFSATDVNNVTTPPTTPNTYTITGTISGTKTVGAGGDYATLTAAVAALNNNEINGPVTLSLTDASYMEAVPFTINANAGSSASNTVTIKPAAGVSPTISGSSTSCIINFNGADYMTIDGSNAVGGTSRDLTITNTSTGTSSAVVCMTSLGAGAGATNDTVKNTNLIGSTLTATNGTLFGVFSGSSTISTSSNGPDNDTNTVQNNNITKTQIGIYSGGENAANKNVGTVISQNVMNAPSPNNLNNGGIYIRFDSGATISQNDISVLRHNGTAGQTGTAFGIALGVIPSNTFSAFTGSDVTGATVARNRVGPVTQLHVTCYSVFGIVVNSFTSGTTLVANNMVSEVVAASTASDFSAGILAGGGTGSTTEVYFNSVSMTGSRNSADYPSYGLAINTGDPIVNVRNNAFVNTQTSTDIGLMYAIGTGSDTFANFTSNYNDFFASGAGTFVGRTGGLGPLLGTDHATLANWQAAVADDANSQSIDPLFVSTSDLHLQGASPILDDGTPIAGVTVDFDGDTRSLTTPDIGADEVGAAPAPGTLQFSAATYNVGEAGPNVTLTVTRTGGSSGAVGATVSFGGGTATGGATCGGSVDYDSDAQLVSFADADTAPKNVLVPVCDDMTFEGDETFDASLGSFTGGATAGSPSMATVTIIENDGAPAPIIAVSDVAFGNVVVGQTVQMNATIQNTGTATLNVGTVLITGANAAEFSVVTSPNGMTVAPGNSIQFPISFTPAAPGIRTATYTVNSNASSGDNVGNLLGTGIQPGTLALSSATYGVSENVGMATITVTRTGGTDGTVGISYGTSNGTATSGASCTAGVDYIPSSGTLSWTNGDSASKTFNITVCDDSLFESAETINIAITLPTGGATLGTPNTAVLTINENDTAPTLQFSSATYSNNDDLADGLGKTDEVSPEVATITVTRTGATENAVSVNFATVAGGTATAGASCTAGIDYISTNGTLNFASGVTMQTFNVTVCSDALFEGDETVNLALNAPTPPAILGTPNTAVLTIVDNETVPTLQFSSATYMNSDDLNSLGETTDEFAPSVATITVTRTGATGNAVSVNYATMAGGTATGGGSCTTGIDYVSTNGTLNFAATETMKTFDVTVCTDLLFEGNETVNLALSSPSAPATLGMPNSAVLTIVDNETVPTLQFSSATYLVTEAGPTATITVTRTGAPDNAVSVNYGTTNGTATGGASCGAVDYVTTSGTLNFVAGDNSETFTVPICDDALAEASETVNLTLSTPGGGAVLGAQNTAVLTITDNDSAPTLQFSSATYSAGEGAGNVLMQVTRGGTSGGAIGATITFTNGTATGGATCAAGVDYINTSQPVSFGDGDTTPKNVNVPICGEAIVEPDETFTATLGTPTGGAVIGTPASAVNTIVNDDTQPGTIALSSATYSVNEGVGMATVTATRTGGTDGAVGVSYGTSNGTATSGASCTAGVDYIPSSGTLSWANGESTSKTFNITVCDDSLFESTETVNVAITLPTGGATLGTPNTAVLTIDENDTAPTVQFSSPTYTNSDDIAQNIGKDGEATPEVAMITVTRTGAADNAFSVNYATSNGTATGGMACGTGSGVDYVTTSGTLNFVAGDMTETFNVTVCTDNRFEGDETVNLTLTSPTAPAVLGMPSAAVLTITDNDTVPSLQFSSATYSNSDDIAKYGVTTDEFAPSLATITVTRTGAVDNTVSVNYATSNGTATGGASCTTGIDYVNASGMLTFAAGVISQTFNVTVCTDALFEGSETVNLTLSTPSPPAILGTPNSAVLTILDNETVPTLQFSSATYAVTEAGPSATITVTRTGAADNAVSVNYGTTNGTATGGASCGAVDYVASSGTLNFVAGDNSETFSVPICEDALAEGAETVNLALSSPSAPAVLGTPNTAVLTITDNDGDVTAPVISYTPIPNNPMATALTATITDAVGVTGASIFWSINGGMYTSAACMPSGGTPQNGTWSCTITGAPNPSAVAYYVTASDAAMNTGTNPTGGAAAPNLFTIGAATVPAGTYTNMSLGNLVSLAGNVSVNGTLTLNGVLNTGANTLTLGCGVPIVGGGEFSYVVGSLKRLFCGVETFTFHVGGPIALPIASDETPLAPEGIASNYSPLAVSITGGTVGSSLEVKVFDSHLAGFDPARSISRNWSLEESGNLTANLAFTYRNEDVNGNESDYRVYRYPGSGGLITNLCPMAPCVDTGTNTASVSNISDFSRWTIAELLVPTAATVSLSGRVVDSSGRGIRNAVLTLEGGGLPEPRTALSSSFGYYTFDGLSIGTYIVTINSKRYTFTVPTRTVALAEDVADVDFVAEPLE